MNTFLPYPDFVRSAHCLDNKRLGKQRVEVLQLLKGSFANHPASKMWRGYTLALANYGLAICREWQERGYKDTCYQKISAYLTFPEEGILLPPWFGQPNFHAAHRSNLLRKDPVFYGQYGWSEPPNLPYVWPINP